MRRTVPLRAVFLIMVATGCGDQQPPPAKKAVVADHTVKLSKPAPSPYAPAESIAIAKSEATAAGPATPKPAPSPPRPMAKPRPMKAAAKLSAPAPTESPYAMMEVLFATDRKQLGGESWNKYFGTEEDAFRYGICKVSIPARHKKGKVERPSSILFFELSEDPAKHVMLRDIVVQDQDAFFSSLRGRLEKASKNQALLFVHGFNNSFAEAARRTAQLAYDLEFKGVPVFYSWPSFGSVDGYGADTETIKLATGKLSGLLDQILKDTQVTELFLIAHSMGNEALTRAFIDVIAKRPDAGRRVKELVLIAPDIDTRVFTREIGPALAAAGAGVTLYAARDDVALLSAKTVRAGFPRAGDISDGVVIINGIETVDATGNDTSLIGHAYFVVRDLYYLINNGSRAAQRFLTVVTDEQGQYWKLPIE